MLRPEGNGRELLETGKCGFRGKTGYYEFTGVNRWWGAAKFLNRIEPPPTCRVFSSGVHASLSSPTLEYSGLAAYRPVNNLLSDF